MQLKSLKLCVFFGMVLILICLFSWLTVKPSEPALPQNVIQTSDNQVKGVSESANFDLLVEETIDCAALIAVTEAEVNGSITANSAAFRQISNTLGQAKLYAANGNIVSTIVTSRYQQLSLQYFQRARINRVEFLQATKDHHQQCLKKAISYSPDRQILELIQQAQKKVN